MARQRIRKRPISEINVVPYIDVMLVLLVIFMITAPLLTQGVKIDLPQAPAEPFDNDAQEPLVVTVDVDGNLYLDYGEDRDSPVADTVLLARVSALLRHRPDTRVMVRGDGEAAYADVIQAMVLLQRAGAPSVGLITEPPEP
jgi:biopolymer transport protein TolR